MMYYEESLEDDYSLMDLAYIYTWRRNEPMRLFYRIHQQRQKKPPKVEWPPPRQGATDSTVTEASDHQEAGCDAHQIPPTSDKESGPVSSPSQSLTGSLPDVPPVEPDKTWPAVERKEAAVEERRSVPTSAHGNAGSKESKAHTGMDEHSAVEAVAEAAREMVVKDLSLAVANQHTKVVSKETKKIAKHNYVIVKETARPFVKGPTAILIKEPLKPAVKEPIRAIVKVPTKLINKETRRVPIKKLPRLTVKDATVKDTGRPSAVTVQTKTGVIDHVKGVSKELLKLTAKSVSVRDTRPQKIHPEPAQALGLPKAGEMAPRLGVCIQSEPTDRSVRPPGTSSAAWSEVTATLTTKASAGAAAIPVTSAVSQSSVATPPPRPAAAHVGASASPPVPSAQASVPTQATTASVPSQPAQTPFQKKAEMAPAGCPTAQVRTESYATSHRKEACKIHPAGSIKERKHSSSEHRQHHRLPEKKKKRLSDGLRCSLDEKRKKQKRLNDISDHLIALPRSHGTSSSYPQYQHQEVKAGSSPPLVASPKLAEPPVANASPASAPVPVQPPIAPVTVVLDRKRRKDPQLSRDDIGALDLSLSHRTQQTPGPQFRPRHVANPAVLDKHRLIACLPAPKYPSFKIVCPSPLQSSSPSPSSVSKKSEGNRHRCKTLTVINPDPTRIVIKNLDMRRDNHHHSHHHHHRH